MQIERAITLAMMAQRGQMVRSPESRAQFVTVIRKVGGDERCDPETVKLAGAIWDATAPRAVSRPMNTASAGMPTAVTALAGLDEFTMEN